MSKQPDIIGIVKELQEQAKNGHGRSFRQKQEWDSRVLDHFHIIAQALIDRDEKLKIAVEALEEIEIGSIKNGKWTTMDKTTCKEVVAEALSRIRSLHTA